MVLALSVAGGMALAHDASHAGHVQPQTAATGPKAEDGAPPDPLANRFGGKFSLTDQTGKRVTDADYRGRYMLIYFGYTSCADTCPIDLSTMGLALDKIGAGLADKVQPLFVTVDPDTDTPKLLSEYVANFHPRLVGLTGTQREIDAVTRVYRVQRHKLLHAATNGAPYIIDHGSLMFLMGPDGKFVTLFPHNTTPDKMAEYLAQYIH